MGFIFCSNVVRPQFEVEAKNPEQVICLFSLVFCGLVFDGFVLFLIFFCVWFALCCYVVLCCVLFILHKHMWKQKHKTKTQNTKTKHPSLSFHFVSFLFLQALLNESFLTHFKDFEEVERYRERDREI